MSVLSINHNLMAANVANSLNDHYSKLATSTQRLSSGLRINSAADDAAGLAIRELMRSDISALRQGMRNVNDAISMLQTFDGALGVIDEKLVRMKELAEQAATGTYNSTQRLMIDSEFQAMGSEINRIARATDFNEVKLLDGAWETAGAAPTTPGAKFKATVSNNGRAANGTALTGAKTNDQIMAGITDVDALAAALGKGTHTVSVTSSQRHAMGNGQYLNIVQTSGPANREFMFEYQNTGWYVQYSNAAPGATNVAGGGSTAQHLIMNAPASMILDGYVTDSNGVLQNATVMANPILYTPATATLSFSANTGTLTAPTITGGNTLNISIDLGNGNTIEQQYTLASGQLRDFSMANFTFNITDASSGSGEIPTDSVKIHFGTANDSAEDYYYIKKHDCTLKGLGLDDVDIQTQDNAQNALVTINDAIVTKDKARAYFGSMQNRLENTMTNITVQAENLTAAESRLSDANIANEMTMFVRNQILTQSAVAMLSQANSVPQMVMRLIQ